MIRIYETGSYTIINYFLKYKYTLKHSKWKSFYGRSFVGEIHTGQSVKASIIGSN